VDGPFSSRLKLFLARLDELPLNQNPPWELIEPPAIPEHLVAIYLLGLATRQNQATDFTQFAQTLDEAKREFRALGGTNEVFLAANTSTLPDIATQEDVQQALKSALQSG
jgi:hypothetical protein